MANSAIFDIHGIDRKVRVVSYEGKYSVEVQYDINDVFLWLPINQVDDWHVCDDEFLKNSIAEADRVIVHAFGISMEDEDAERE